MQALARFWDSDVAYSFRQSPVAIGATVVAIVMVFSAVFAAWVAPHNPFDLATLNLLDASLPPAWEEGGQPQFILGTDDQGRDVYSAILYGMQISLAIGAASVVLSIVLGVGLGLLSGYVGGRVDAFIMRICDVDAVVPGDPRGPADRRRGACRVAARVAQRSRLPAVLVLAIALSGWVQYARTVRGSTLVEKNKEYVQAGAGDRCIADGDHGQARAAERPWPGARARARCTSRRPC